MTDRIDIVDLIGSQQIVNLSVMYSQPHRAYHNLSHIHHCLAEFDEWQKTCQPTLSDASKSAMACAIWYHDVVYNPYIRVPGNNEEESISFFHAEQERKSCGVGRYVFELASLMIHDTVYHMISENVSEVIKKNGKFGEILVVRQAFLDIDLAILGQSPETYAKYAKNIRKEYEDVSDSDFRMGRMKILENLLSAPRLYYTDHFSKKYEAQARINVGNEILSLK